MYTLSCPQTSVTKMMGIYEGMTQCVKVLVVIMEQGLVWW